MDTKKDAAGKRRLGAEGGAVPKAPFTKGRLKNCGAPIKAPFGKGSWREAPEGSSASSFGEVVFQVCHSEPVRTLA